MPGLMPQRPPPADLARLLQRLRDGDLDGAIEAGLMDCDPALAGTASDIVAIVAAQRTLDRAWAARERHRARNARLARRAAERDAGRLKAPAPQAGASTLPAAAAAALARARAKAAGKP